MIDAILLVLLVAVVGTLVAAEIRNRRAAREAASSLETLIDQPRDPKNGYYWRLVRQAGLAPDAVWPIFLGSKITLMVAVPLMMVEVMAPSLLRIVLAGIFGFLVPDMIFAWVRRERQVRVRLGLSFFLDMLVSLLQAGLSLDEAFRRVAKEGLSRDHPLAEEAMIVVEEMEMGRDRSAGFQALAERTGVSELKAVANALGLGMTLGSSVEATLKSQADLARAKRREEAIRRLNVASAEILLPLILCGFPLFSVLVFFPLALQFMAALQGVSGVLR